MSQQYDDAMDQYRDAQVAQALGITVDELARAPYEIQEDASDDGLVYSVMIVFEEGSDVAVLAKIDDLEDGNFVRLSPGFFDEADEPEQ